jgi:hypothetical protein
MLLAVGNQLSAISRFVFIRNLLINRHVSRLNDKLFIINNRNAPNASRLIPFATDDGQLCPQLKVAGLNADQPTANDKPDIKKVDLFVRELNAF